MVRFFIFKIKFLLFYLNFIHRTKDRITINENDDERIKFLSESLSQNQTKFSLIIKNSTNENSGNYIATIKNLLGQTSTQSKVNILSGPQIIKELFLSTCSTQASETKTDEYNVLSLNQKSNFRLECQINGQPKPVIKWYQDEKELFNNEKLKLENKQDNYFVTIKDFSMKDRGLYKIEAKNDCGISTSKVFIEINTPPVLIKGLTNSEIVLSDNEQVLELVCSYIAKPKADVLWILGEKQIRPDNIHSSIIEESSIDSNGQEIFTSILKIQNLSLADAGVYKCKFKNCVGEIATSGTLSLLKGQLFSIKLPLQLEMKEKNEIKLECKLDDSNPKSVVSWFKDGIALSASKRILISKPIIEPENNNTVYSITVLDSTGVDSGIYTVKSVSKLATIESSCDVSILSAPKITKDLKPTLQCSAGNELALEVTATGKPDPEYKWFWLNQENNEIEILSSDTIKISRTNNIYSLLFTKIITQMKGKYILRLTNNAGTAEASCSILIDGNISK